MGEEDLTQQTEAQSLQTVGCSWGTASILDASLVGVRETLGKKSGKLVGSRPEV